LNSQCLEFHNAGKYDEAIEPCQLSLAIYEKALGGEHPLVAMSLNNLADMYREKGEYAKAEPLYQRALAINEKVLGIEHPDVAFPLNSLASLYESKGEYAKAEPLYQRALAIREKVLGSEHPDVAISLNNLAGLYYSKGEYMKAEMLLQRALTINEKALGSEHPLVATMLNNVAWLYEAKEDYPRATEFLMRAQEIRESNINAILATGSEKQKQLYLDTLSGETDGIVSLHAYSARSNVQAARLALTTILRRKGRALDAMTDQIAGLRRRAAPRDIKLLDALTNAQSQLANLQLSNDTRLSPAERRTYVTELETQIEKLQGDIGRRNVEFRARTQAVTLDAVQQAIPADAALVEIFAYHRYNAKAKSIAEYYGKARYVAYVLKPTSDAPQFVDLGDAAQVDADLKLWRAALLNPERENVRALGRRVDERVMRPVRKLLGTTKRLFISPDGALNLIPFAALVDENNKYLMETYALDYLTSGRDLLRLQVRSETRPGAVIFANPTYNLTGQPIAACGRRKPRRGLLLDVEDADAASEKKAIAKRDIAYRGIDFTQVCYPPLRGTAEEATRINAALPGATVLTDKSATEAALKALNSPPILHIATHGFFLPDQPQTLNTNATQSGGTKDNENPLLRSGLIMAGANQKASGTGQDGVLTAFEAAGLNLWGTKLVVLSACETGLGDVVNGAGVYGLRRALVLAGSETQVMSLWQVDDEATRDLMSDYYTRLQRGEGRTEAMRSAQLAMLRGETQARAKGTRKPRQRAPASAILAHPYYWAAFISSGDWHSMNGKEQ
jgi:CHAT domain-containing protein